MERKVKYLQVEWFHPDEDPITGNTRNVLRTARHGVTLHSAEWDDPEDTETDIYGVPESELLRIEKANPGAFYGEFESDLEPVVNESATGLTDADAVDPSDGVPVPLPPGDLAEWQIVEYFRQNDPTPEELFDMVDDEDDPVRKVKLIQNIMAAEAEITQGEPRDEVIIGMSGRLGAVSGGAPDTAVVDPSLTEGSPDGPPPSPLATDPDATGGDDTGKGIAPTGPQSEVDPAGSPLPTSPPVDVEATDAAKAMAARDGVDLRLVSGTGRDGRITEADVRDYQKAMAPEN